MKNSQDEELNTQFKNMIEHERMHSVFFIKLYKSKDIGSLPLSNQLFQNMVAQNIMHLLYHIACGSELQV